MSAVDREYKNLGDLLAEVFDPYLSRIPGTHERRRRVIQCARYIERFPASKKSRNRLQRMRAITMTQLSLIQSLQETLH